jgi:hypothetical protein
MKETSRKHDLNIGFRQAKNYEWNKMSKTTKGSCEKIHQHDQMVNERGGRPKSTLLFIPKCVKSTSFNL